MRNPRIYRKIVDIREKEFSRTLKIGLARFLPYFTCLTPSTNRTPEFRLPLKNSPLNEWMNDWMNVWGSVFSLCLVSCNPESNQGSAVQLSGQALNWYLIFCVFTIKWVKFLQNYFVNTRIWVYFWFMYSTPSINVLYKYQGICQLPLKKACSKICLHLLTLKQTHALFGVVISLYILP